MLPPLAHMHVQVMMAAPERELVELRVRAEIASYLARAKVTVARSACVRRLTLVPAGRPGRPPRGATSAWVTCPPPTGACPDTAPCCCRPCRLRPSSGPPVYPASATRSNPSCCRLTLAQLLRHAGSSARPCAQDALRSAVSTAYAWLSPDVITISKRSALASAFDRGSRAREEALSAAMQTIVQASRSPRVRTRRG
jgi:hypothetical protein